MGKAHNNLAACRLIVLKFGDMVLSIGAVHYRSAEPASWLKPGTTGRTGGLKWQCTFLIATFPVWIRLVLFLLL